MLLTIGRPGSLNMNFTALYERNKAFLAVLATQSDSSYDSLYDVELPNSDNDSTYVPVPVQTSRNLTNDERNYVLHFLLTWVKPGEGNELKRGANKEAAARFSCSTRTVRQIWNRYLTSVNTGYQGGDVSTRKGNCGRKKKGIDVVETCPASTRRPSQPTQPF